MKEYLPVGSIVKLIDNDRYIMIIGLMQTNAQTKERYDYTGTLYPMGYNPEADMYMFNETDIENIFYKGYEVHNHQIFVDQLKAFLHIDEYIDYEYSNEEVVDFFKEEEVNNKAIIDSSFIEL